jgi:hypothetical protein
MLSGMKRSKNNCQNIDEIMEQDTNNSFNINNDSKSKLIHNSYKFQKFDDNLEKSDNTFNF